MEKLGRPSKDKPISHRRAAGMNAHLLPLAGPPAFTPAISSPLPLVVHNTLTWPEPATSFAYEADATESSDELKRRLAAHIGYLALDVMLVDRHGRTIGPNATLGEEGLASGDEITIVRRTLLGSATPATQSASRRNQSGPASSTLERYCRSAFALSVVEVMPGAPVLLRMLQLDHGRLPSLDARCDLQRSTAAADLGALLVQLGALPAAACDQPAGAALGAAAAAGASAAAAIIADAPCAPIIPAVCKAAVTAVAAVEQRAALAAEDEETLSRAHMETLRGVGVEGGPFATLSELMGTRLDDVALGGALGFEGSAARHVMSGLPLLPSLGGGGLGSGLGDGFGGEPGCGGGKAKGRRKGSAATRPPAVADMDSDDELGLHGCGPLHAFREGLDDGRALACGTEPSLLEPVTAQPHAAGGWPPAPPSSKPLASVMPGLLPMPMNASPLFGSAAMPGLPLLPSLSGGLGGGLGMPRVSSLSNLAGTPLGSSGAVAGGRPGSRGPDSGGGGLGSGGGGGGGGDLGAGEIDALFDFFDEDDNLASNLFGLDGSMPPRAAVHGGMRTGLTPTLAPTAPPSSASPLDAMRLDSGAAAAAEGLSASLLQGLTPALGQAARPRATAKQGAMQGEASADTSADADDEAPLDLVASVIGDGPGSVLGGGILSGGTAAARLLAKGTLGGVLAKGLLDGREPKKRRREPSSERAADHLSSARRTASDGSIQSRRSSSEEPESEDRDAKSDTWRSSGTGRGSHSSHGARSEGTQYSAERQGSLVGSHHGSLLSLQGMEESRSNSRSHSGSERGEEGHESSGCGASEHVPGGRLAGHKGAKLPENGTAIGAPARSRRSNAGKRKARGE